MALPTEQDPVYPMARPSRQEACTNLLSLSITGRMQELQEEAKTIIP